MRVDPLERIKEQISQGKGKKTEAPHRRVVITGMGAMTPIGGDVPTAWRSMLDGAVGISALDAFDASRYKVALAAQIRGFDPIDHMDRKEARRMDRFCQFAVAATREAVAQSGLDLTGIDPYRIGCIYGTGIGGLWTIEEQFGTLHTHGPERISPLFVPMMIGNMAAGTLSMRYGAKGFSASVTTACASGTTAIGESFLGIRHGRFDVCLTGGTEAPITPIAVAGFSNMKALSTSKDPLRASIPFDAERGGFVIGEGAGTLVLESLDHALSRGAVILAEVCGYGATSDAYHVTSPDPAGEAAAMAMALAVADAGMGLEEIGYINAHGTSTELNDKYETLAIHRCFDAHAGRLAVSSTKGVTGHLLGAAGAVEAIATVQALTQGILPPTAGYRIPDPECDLDYVVEGPRAAVVTAALSNSLGFGGHNGTLCLKRFEL
ncbi:MAG: beta-ketoacyl-ACP synthase II [Clostridia bacterium]|nr:beta-ketoacyl-ACP synthase II [Clostridia bacterium]